MHLLKVLAISSILLFTLGCASDGKWTLEKKDFIDYSGSGGKFSVTWPRNNCPGLLDEIQKVKDSLANCRCNVNSEGTLICTFSCRTEADKFNSLINKAYSCQD